MSMVRIDNLNIFEVEKIEKFLLTIKIRYYINADVDADIAQLVELLICNQWVGSSSLSVGTSFLSSWNSKSFFVVQHTFLLLKYIFQKNQINFRLKT